MSIRRSNFKILGLVLVLYLYIYAPPLRILPINISSIIGAMGCLFFLVRPQKVRLLLHFKWELLILFAMFLYALVLYPVALSPEFLTPFHYCGVQISVRYLGSVTGRSTIRY